MLNSLSQSTECSCFIKSHDIKIDILSSENILVNETLIIQNNSTESMDNIYLWFNQSYANLIVENDLEYRLALIWTFTDLNPYDNQLLFLFYDEPIGGDPLIWLFIIGPVLGLSFGVIGTIWMMRRREKRAVKKLGTIFLSETQKKFLEIIVENGGRISQKELTTMTGYTKARVSRNLISLEQQQMITREKWGRNYRIFITETGVKVVK
ncbi:MAG: helix-turn-helix transcriptional regulator [Candidatus Heimdallarchaeaceae archaeon]